MPKSPVYIGRGCICEIVFPSNEYLSARHLQIIRSSSTAEISMIGKNGGYVSDYFLKRGDRKIIKYGDVIKLPDVSIVWLNEYILVGTSDEAFNSTLSKVDLKTDEDFGEEANMLSIFNPPPRVRLYTDNAFIELEAPPEKREEDSYGILSTIGPAFTMAIPMILGFFITYIAGKSSGNSSMAFMYTGLITAVTSAIFGGFWASVNLKNRKVALAESERKRVAAYEKYVINSENKIKEKYYGNRNILRELNPSISEKILNHKPADYIYSKDILDDDSFEIRLGTGSLPFDAEIRVPKEKLSLVSDELKEIPFILKNKYSNFYDVPICINLIEKGPVGVISNDFKSILQIIYLITITSASAVRPDNFKIAFLFSEKNEFSNLSNRFILLPHVWEKDVFLFASERSQISRVVDAIKDVKRTLIITDSYRKIEGYFQSFNEEKPGFSGHKCDDKRNMFLIISDSYINLPECCKSVIQRESQFSGIIYLEKNVKKRQEVFFDSINDDVVDECIKELARLSYGIFDKETEIPTYVSFLDTLGIRSIDENFVLNNWINNSPVEEICVPIGIATGNVPLILDFHDKKHGPHGLIGGTTGSGKSEILQTIILALSIKYSPEDVAFLLIDYKGGGMANLFEKLPHIAGIISNLSGSMVRRAMVSIKSENERRQKAFYESGVNNIHDYIRQYKAGNTKEPIPHIFIVVDEFAELKREQPDFMKELISVARVGRSLGVHLILATQKPAGVIDDNILSNTRFKICLRLQDKMDSSEILHRPDAAYIKNPGRAFIQVGNDELFSEFQGAYTMATYCEGDSDGKGITFVGENGELIEKEIIHNNEAPTELQVVLDKIELAGKNYERTYRCSLWQPPLPNVLTTDNYRDYREICIGIYDNPIIQKQDTLRIDFAKDGHILILGSISSGKSTLLKTISYELITKYDSDLFNIYFIDFNALRLKIFGTSNMCGGYFYDENAKDVEKLFIMLEEIADERKQNFDGLSFEQYAVRHGNIPRIVVIVDGVGSFRERTNGDYDDTLLRLLKTGENLGIYFVISALNISTTEITNRMSEYFRTVFTLNLNDRYLYAQAHKVLAEKIIIPENIKGRGLCKVDNEILEFQSFCICESGDELEINDLILLEINEMNSKRSNSLKARKAPVIPDNPTAERLIQDVLIGTSKLSNKLDIVSIPVGYEMKSGKVYSLPLKQGRNVIVSGNPGTGKTEFLNCIKIIGNTMGLDVKEINDYSFENVMISDERGTWIIGVYSNSFSINESVEFKEVIGNEPYVIHFGGGLDRVSIADFSYIPFTKQGEIKPPGIATVHRTTSDEFYGDIVIVKEK